MIVVTAGTGDYRRIIEKQAQRCAEFGYQHVVYDLGGLGFGEPYAVDPEDLKPTINGDSLPPATFKARLVEKQWERAGDGEVVCWMDADCIPLKEFMPPLPAWPYDKFMMSAIFSQWDAAVTLRPAPEVGLSNNNALDYLNSGVVWIRKTARGRAFCAAWRYESERLRTDQGALNYCVVHPACGVDWRSLYGEIVVGHSDAKILILNALDWNNWHFPPHPDVRILHFKRGVRYLAKDYIK